MKEELHDLYRSPVISVMKEEGKWAGHLTEMRKTRNRHINLLELHL